MQNRRSYEAKLPLLMSIESGNVKEPHHIPADIYIDEARELCKRLMEDREDLIAAGLDPQLTADLPVRLEALAVAQEDWESLFSNRSSRPPEWHHLAQLALKLKKGILQLFRFAFRNNPKLLKDLRRISKGDSHTKVILDLKELKVIGRQHSGLLESIRFDMSLLDEAVRISGDMSDQLSEVTVDQTKVSELKSIRNRAYTHLKEAIDEIRCFGRHVFQYDKKHAAAYRSEFLRKLKKRKPLRPRKQPDITHSSPPTE